MVLRQVTCKSKVMLVGTHQCTSVVDVSLRSGEN